MTNFEYDNLPETDLTVLPDSMQPAAVNFVLRKLSELTPIALQVSGAHVYDRKGYLSTDALGGPRNKSYGSDNDDVVLSVTLRISARDAENIVKTSRKHYEEKIQAEKKAEAEALDATIAELTSKREGIRSEFDV